MSIVFASHANGADTLTATLAAVGGGGGLAAATRWPAAGAEASWSALAGAVAAVVSDEVSQASETVLGWAVAVGAAVLAAMAAEHTPAAGAFSSCRTCTGAGASSGAAQANGARAGAAIVVTSAVEGAVTTRWPAA